MRSVALATLLSFAGCGYFLYPERRGNSGGTVDGGTLVMDLLWLLPGLVPGVVALIVDFSSGAVYTGHTERVAVTIPPSGRVAVLLPESPKPAQLEVRLATSDHRVLARRTAQVGPTVHHTSVELQLDAAARPSPDQQVYVEMTPR